MSTIYTAKKLYESLREEPAFYKKKMRGMVCGSVINIEFKTTTAYQRDLERYSADCKRQVTTLERFLSRSNKKEERDERETARELKTKLTDLATECTTLAKNIERTVDDFKKLERSFTNNRPKFAASSKKRTIKNLVPRQKGKELKEWVITPALMGKVSAGGGAKLQLTTSKQQYRFADITQKIGKEQSLQLATADLPQYGLSESEKQQLIDDTLTHIIDNVPSFIKLSNVLTEEQREYLKQFIFYDEAGFAYVNQRESAFAYLLDQKFGTKYASVSETCNNINEDSMKQPNPSGYIGIFYSENGELKNYPISRTELEETKENIALMHISNYPAEAFEQLPNTFKLFGLEWFNTKKYEQLLSAESLTQQNLSDINEMVEFAYDTMTRRPNTSYIIEQLYFSSLCYNTIDTDASTPNYTSLIPRKNLQRFVEQYISNTIQEFDNQGVVNIYDKNYKINQEANNKRVEIASLLQTIANNTHSSMFDISYENMTLGSRLIPPIKSTKKYLGLSNMLGTPTSLADIQTYKKVFQVVPIMNNDHAVGYAFVDSSTQSRFASITSYNLETGLEKDLIMQLDGKKVSFKDYFWGFITGEAQGKVKGTITGEMVNAAKALEIPYVKGMIKIVDTTIKFEKGWNKTEQSNRFYSSAISNIQSQQYLRAIGATEPFP